jgi:ABC-type branched-subunit amino acid transport system substrate-binding protein
MTMNVAQRTQLGFRSRSRTYTLITSVVVVMLAAGLTIPFVFGKSVDTVNTAAANPLGLGKSDRVTGGSGGDGGAVTASESTSTGVGGAAGTAPGGATGSGLAGGSSGVAGLTASDRGVTPTTVTVAFLLADLGSLSQLGFGVPGFNVKDQEAYMRAFVDNINAQGGVLGRQIDPVFVSYDPTNQQTSQTACRAATQDHEIFAAIDSGGGLNEQGQRCFTEQNHTPLIALGSFGTPPALYQQSGGYLFTINASGLRSLANMAYLLDARGLLKGKKIGIIDRDFPGTVQTVTDGMVATLKEYGYEVTYRVDLSMDDGTAASQVPVAAQQMQAHGVDAVMLFSDFIVGSEFVQAADRSLYRPLYFASDFGPMTNDIAVQAMPASFKAVGVTTARTGEWRIGLPEPAVDAACREIYTRATGANPARSDNAYGGMDNACGLVDLVVRAATASGPELTRVKFVDGLQQIGRIPYPLYGGFSYGPGKFDGADSIRTLVSDSSCGCWMPQGDFVEPRY